MELAKGVLVLTIPLGAIYIFLGWFAYKHAEDKILGAYSWWAFHPSNFNATGKNLCRVGRFVAYAAFALCIPYLVVVVGGI